jgi:hypothetical protein
MFIYSVPILLDHIQLGTIREYMVIILFLFLLLTIVTASNPFYKEIQWGKISDLTMYQYLFDAWNGQVKLWLVFWPFFIIANVILYVTDNLAMMGKFTVSSWDDVHLMLVIPIFFWLIAVWRNSLNTRFRYGAVAARFATLSVFFEYGLKLVIRMDYPRIFFQCHEAMLDYASCF